MWEKRAIDVAHGKPGNAQIISLGLRNRSRSTSGWHDTAQLEHSGPDGAPVRVEQKSILDVAKLTPAQRDALRELLIAARAQGDG